MKTFSSWCPSDRRGRAAPSEIATHCPRNTAQAHSSRVNPISLERDFVRGVEQRDGVRLEVAVSVPMQVVDGAFLSRCSTTRTNRIESIAGRGFETLLDRSPAMLLNETVARTSVGSGERPDRAG